MNNSTNFSPLLVRFDKKTKSDIEALAYAEKTSQSQIVRDAVEKMLQDRNIKIIIEKTRRG